MRAAALGVIGDLLLVISFLLRYDFDRSPVDEAHHANEKISCDGGDKVQISFLSQNGGPLIQRAAFMAQSSSINLFRA